MLWSTTDGTLWHRLVIGRGWTDDRYATWLGRMWVSMLVADDGGGLTIPSPTHRTGANPYQSSPDGESKSEDAELVLHEIEHHPLQ